MEKDTLVVNLFGGPGVGKSTTAAAVFSLLKLHDVDCELVPEFAKDLVWEERFKTFENQYYIFGKQQHRLWRVKGKVAVVVTDCPLMLSPIYGERYNNTNKFFAKNVAEIVESFNNLNILLTRTKKYNQNGRNETEDQAREVDKAVTTILSDFGMSWKEVPGNFEGINTIVKMILKSKQKFKIVV
jgi:nicotinamide riboside kinase